MARVCVAYERTNDYLNSSHLSLAAMFCGKVYELLGGIHSNVATLRHIGWLVGWLASDHRKRGKCGCNQEQYRACHCIPTHLQPS